VAALAAAVALFVALQGGRGDSATAQPQTPERAVERQSAARSAAPKPQSARAKTSRHPAKPAKRAKPKLQRIWVRNGNAAGGPRRLEFKRGELVRFAIHSTAADEVHIHGYDVTKALPANRIVPFTFSAEIEGVFDVELHGAHVKIAELRITP
jgi:hypothetical protein